MDRLVSSTASLYKKMEELSNAEHAIRRHSNTKETSICGESFDSVVSLLAPFAFVLLLFRIRRAFLLL
ncbi:hypothetical protein QJS10_CPA08g00300 [Acorus calamus]|uniref:Uncharacterized protein n=1 Tax=Acorus calamus TaxID=4465 RepID=A0AAV9CYH1_ACOCL|nr:hypothetical protein QJS10_CPA16g01218 [Acorus calamus]KAK1296448.1 hypothetical protein QJS10_CPB15g00940 [Acorus calamus]KAK1309954.1 hypothetical protein QJS10_CPA08g00300 [Acorus calamus]